MALFSPKDSRVRDLDTNQLLKPHQAESRIAAGVAEGVYEHGKLTGIRRMNLQEMVAKRSEMARAEAQRHLEPSEIHGVVFRGVKSELWTSSLIFECLKGAREFALGCAR